MGIAIDLLRLDHTTETRRKAKIVRPYWGTYSMTYSKHVRSRCIILNSIHQSNGKRTAHRHRHRPPAPEPDTPGPLYRGLTSQRGGLSEVAHLTERARAVGEAEMAGWQPTSCSPHCKLIANSLQIAETVVGAKYRALQDGFFHQRARQFFQDSRLIRRNVN